MKIKKNGKVIRLTESDLKKIVKRVLKEEVKRFTLYKSDGKVYKKSVNGKIGAFTYEDMEEEVSMGVVEKVKDGFKYKPGYPK